MSTIPLLRVVGFRHPQSDDRGKPTKIAKPMQIRRVYGLGTRRRFAINERLGSAKMVKRPQPMIGRLRWTAAINLITATVITSIILLTIFTPVSAAIGWIAGLLFSLIMIFIHSHYSVQATSNLIGMTTLSEGFCASCVFSLEGLGPEDDGCIVCPECGHSWNALRIVRPHWEPDDESIPIAKDPRLDYRKTMLRMMLMKFSPDDCGRLVRVHNTRLWAAANETRAQHATQDLETVIHELRCLGRVRRWIAFLILTSVVLLGVVFWMIPVLSESVSGGIAIFVFLGIAQSIAFLVLAGSMWANPMSIARTLTSHGMCGSCLNGLGECAANANNMRVCDRCKASWLDDRFPEPRTLQDSYVHE